RARAVGAANTLWLDGDVLRSTNTDVEGFLNNLDACAPGWDRGLGKALVLGGGGAARAVVYALLERGIAPIVVANRTGSRAEALRARFRAQVHRVDWDERNAALDDAALIVNTTTLSMAGQAELTLDIGRLPGHAIVADLVYWPLITPLLRSARARGLRTADGLGMLMHQAVGGFTLWFGKKPEVTAELRALLEADLSLPPASPSE
ncbi:MAG: shikimate dehydrogenase, partial [Xanthobacteraceae bacterium]